MAIVTAPLMSLGTTGKFAQTLVYQGQRARQIARRFSIPATPLSALQLAQQGQVSLSVASWHREIATADDREAWERLARQNHKRMSGYSYFQQIAIKSLNVDPARGYAFRMRNGPDWKAAIDLQNLVDGTTAFHGGTHTVKWGLSATSLVNEFQSDTASGWVTWDPAIGTTTRIFAQILKDGEPRSGVMSLVLSNVLPDIFPDPFFNSPSIWTLGTQWAIAANVLKNGASMAGFGQATIQMPLSEGLYKVVASIGADWGMVNWIRMNWAGSATLQWVGSGVKTGWLSPVHAGGTTFAVQKQAMGTPASYSVYYIHLYDYRGFLP